MAQKSLDGLFRRKYQVGIGEAIKSNRKSDSGFGYFKQSKRISL